MALQTLHSSGLSVPTPWQAAVGHYLHLKPVVGDIRSGMKIYSFSGGAHMAEVFGGRGAAALLMDFFFQRLPFIMALFHGGFADDPTDNGLEKSAAMCTMGPVCDHGSSILATSVVAAALPWLACTPDVVMLPGRLLSRPCRLDLLPGQSRRFVARLGASSSNSLQDVRSSHGPLDRRGCGSRSLSMFFRVHIVMLLQCMFGM